MPHIHTHKHPAEFEQLARTRRAALLGTLERVMQCTHCSLAETELLISELDGASHWYAGGSKEMRTALPQWAQCERKIEQMTEYSLVRSICVHCAPEPGRCWQT